MILDLATLPGSQVESQRLESAASCFADPGPRLISLNQLFPANGTVERHLVNLRFENVEQAPQQISLLVRECIP